jgi:hypothetical protein
MDVQQRLQDQLEAIYLCPELIAIYFVITYFGLFFSQLGLVIYLEDGSP